MAKRKICVVTGTRADYGLLRWLMQEIQDDCDLELQIIATGMHLSSEFGLTYREIEKDFKIDIKIEMLTKDDDPVGISKSMGTAHGGFAEAYNELQPDLVVVLGDRYEILVAATIAMIARIPIAHIHGGETTVGAIDEAIRHSITKMSHIHFVATQEYKNRVIQLGEHPDTVFNVGGMGVDSIQRMKLLSQSELEEAIKFKLNKKNLQVTFHPVTLENNTAGAQFKSLLNALEKLEDTNIIFTGANSDTDGRAINHMIKRYVSKHPGKAVYFTSMGQLKYFSALQFVDGVLGNSSSGLLEAPSFKVGTINIGSRQQGRIKADSVIDCEPESDSISAALFKLYSPDFQKKLKKTINPYGNGGASAQIKKLIKSYNLKNILKKKFFDRE